MLSFRPPLTDRKRTLSKTDQCAAAGVRQAGEGARIIGSNVQRQVGDVNLSSQARGLLFRSSNTALLVTSRFRCEPNAGRHRYSPDTDLHDDSPSARTGGTGISNVTIAPGFREKEAVMAVVLVDDSRTTTYRSWSAGDGRNGGLGRIRHQPPAWRGVLGQAKPESSNRLQGF